MRVMIVVVVCTACTTSAPATPPTLRPSTCPPVALVEELHAATFYAEHGSADDAREHIRRADGLAERGPMDATATATFDALHRLAPHLDDPAVTRVELERIRIGFADWPCLPDDVHARFHHALPPLP